MDRCPVRAQRPAHVIARGSDRRSAGLWFDESTVRPSVMPESAQRTVKRKCTTPGPARGDGTLDENGEGTGALVPRAR
jgi:hypothetical protein